MTQDVARTCIRLTAVYAEQLHDITNNPDALLREGYNDWAGATERYVQQWDSLYASSPIPLILWNDNPFVYVLNFKMADRSEAMTWEIRKSAI